MSIFTSVKKRYERITAKQFIVAGVFMLAFAGAVGGGFASKNLSSAAIIRDNDQANSIDNSYANGGIGAADANELIADIPTVGDLSGIYTNFGMDSSEYQRFLQTAKSGMAYKNGTVVVDGQVVMNDAFSIGRTKFWYSWQHSIAGVGNYWASMHTDVLGQDLPVMVMFDENGTAEFVVMNACGNPVYGERVTSGAECKELVMTPVPGKKDTYKFTTNATKFGLAQIVKYEYFYNDGAGEKKFGEATSGSEAVEKTFDKAATVTVKVTINLPGGKTKVIVSELCKKKVGVVKEEFLYVCDALIASARDNTNRKFRFTVRTKQSNNVTVDSADFTLDNQVTTKGVTTKDGSNNIYKDYDFNDTVTHTVSVIVNFTADGKKVTSKVGACVSKVTPEKTPECIEKPGSGFPPGDERCKEQPPLPKTGAGGVAGLFAGVAAAGTIGHRAFMSRRARRS